MDMSLYGVFHKFCLTPVNAFFLFYHYSHCLYYVINIATGNFRRLHVVLNAKKKKNFCSSESTIYPIILSIYSIAFKLTSVLQNIEFCTTENKVKLFMR